MTDLPLRPLSLGEILDRSFSLYRSYWSLFVGISALPFTFILVFIPFFTVPMTEGRSGSLGSFVSLVYYVVLGFAYLCSQGCVAFAVSDFCLGRPASISESLGRAWADFGLLLGAAMLSGLAIAGASILLIIPGIYVMCRLLVCMPAAAVERRGPWAALSRSFVLTRGSVGRALVISLLAIVLTLMAQTLLQLAVGIAAGFSAQKLDLASSPYDPRFLRFSVVIGMVSNFAAAALVAPIPSIATSVFYYDLRVRKEALDLQLMMNTDAGAD